MIPAGQVDVDKALRYSRDFRIVELKELLNIFGYGNARYGNKAQLQNRVEELLRSDKQKSVAYQIFAIMNRLRGGATGGYATQRNDVVRNTAISYGSGANRYGMPNQPAYNRAAPAYNFPNINAPPFVPDASKVRLVPLPFYDVQQALLPMQALVSPHRNDGTYANTTLRFSIPREYAGRLSFRESDPLPRFEVQLRMAICESGKEQPDALPVNLKISINNALVTLPPLINQPQQPGQAKPEQKRASRPINITPYCNPVRDNPYQMIVEWLPEGRIYLIGVWIVYHVNPVILRDRLLNSGPKYYEETRALIKTNLGKSSEDDIAMDTLKISLVCPLSRVKMITPVRPMSCTHLQCFDLHNYLMMNEKRPSWKCPVCNKPCSYSGLAVDSYFAEIIGKVGGRVKEVELLTDGGWRVIEDKGGSGDFDDDIPSAPQSMSKPDSARSSTAAVVSDVPSVSAPASTKPPQSAPDIITLDDSDDEAVAGTANSKPSASPAAKQSPAPVSQMESRKRPHDHQPQASSTQDKRHEIITLDSDSDDEPPPNNGSQSSAVSTPVYTAAIESTTSNEFLGKPLNLDDAGSVEGLDSSFSTINSATVEQISLALADFLQRLEEDTKKYAV